MVDQRKLLLFWAWMLLVAALCPWAGCKRGGGFKGRGKGVGLGGKAPPTQSRGSSRQGPKLAGAAVAGALGGAAIGYGLGSLGRPRYGHGYNNGHGYSEEDRRFYYPEGTGFQNRSSDWRYYKGAASSRHTSGRILIVLGSMVPLFLVDWI